MNATVEPKPTRLTAPEILSLIAQYKHLAWKLARRFYASNRAISLTELRAEAEASFKRAALLYDPSRGQAQFSTYAYRLAYNDLIALCRVESARGMHVPTNHEPYYAPRPMRVKEDWQHPAVAIEEEDESVDPRFTVEFWESVARGLTPREQASILGCFRDGKLQAEVAKELGCSKSLIGFYKKQAMKKLAARLDLREMTEPAVGRKAA